MELKQIAENVYYIPNSTNVGVIKDGDSAILIDSGLDDYTGKKILQTLENNKLQPKAIITTHFHADHCGANAYIKEKTGAFIYAPELEAEFVQYPLLEPLSLFSCANPPNDLKNKFLMARPSNVDHIITSKDESLFFGDVSLKTIRLAGHSPNQIGISFNDVLFCADSLFSQEVLNKHKIPFLNDVEKYKETLLFLKHCNYKSFVPSHADLTPNIAELANINFKVIDDVEKNIIDFLVDGKTTENVLKALCDRYKIEVKGIQQYYLMNTISLAFLSYLCSNGTLKFELKENSLIWQRIKSNLP